MKIGDIYGRLTLIERAEKSHYGKSRWVCLCSCGNTHTADAGNIKQGKTKSCGCLVNDSRPVKHGLSDTPTAWCWGNMKKRCLNPKASGYKDYGGRGITVCDRWLDKDKGFLNFLEDMGECPEGMSIDRVDVNGAYCPENCRWVDRQTQQRNKRKKVGTTSQYKGVTWKEPSQKWQVKITTPTGHNKYIGVYEDETTAAKVWDDLARSFGFEESWLNFPNES